MENSTIFRKLAAPALISAAIFSILHFYAGGYQPIIFVIFMHVALYMLNKPVRPLIWYFDVMIIGFGTGRLITPGSGYSFFCSVAGVIAAVSALIYIFYDEYEWGFMRHLKAMGRMVINALSEIPSPIKGCIETGNNNSGIKIILAFAIGIPVVIILTLLLVSSDAIFGNLVGEIFTMQRFSDIICIVIETGVMFFVWYCIISALVKKCSDAVDEPATPGMDALIGIIVTTMIAILYAAFSLVQIFGLFIGKMSLPEGYTYSEYAREGFFELLAVCIINIIIVLVCRWCFTESKVLNVILTVICIATYIMLASSAFRMTMYVSAYGLTRLRFTTYAGLIVIGIVLIWIITSIYRAKFGLYRYMLITCLTGYFVLVNCNMDYWIKSVNMWTGHGA